MTENEKVKKWFKTELSMRIEESLDAIDCEDVMDICIKALEEIQQYREIGLTPKMVKEMIESEKLASHQAIIRGAKLEQYEAIGTIEELKALKEKRKMKPLKAYDEEREANWCSCPNCTKGIGWEYERHFNFCNNCGTELDWSE